MKDHKTTREVDVRRQVLAHVQAGFTSIPAVPDAEDIEAVARLDVDPQERDHLAAIRKAGLMMGLSEEQVDRILRESVAEARKAAIMAREDKE